MINRLRETLARRHHVRAHFWQSLAGYTQTGGAMILGVILARLLSPEVFGQFAFITASITMMMVPLNVSSTQVLITDGGRTPGLLGKVMGLAALTTGLKLTVVLFFVSWELAHGRPGSAVVGALVGLPTALADWLDVLRADLEGRGIFKPNFEVQFGGMLVHASVSIGLVLLGWGIYGLAVAGFAAFLPQIALYLRAGGRRRMEITLDRDSVLGQLRLGWWLWLTTTSSALMFRIDKIVLGKFGGEAQLGYYNRALNYSPFCMMAMGSLLTNAAVVAFKNQRSGAERRKVVGKAVALMTAGSAINWLILYFFSDPLVVWIFGPHWADSIPVFRAFAWLSLAYAFYYLPMNVLLALDAYRLLALCRLAGLLVFSCGLWWLHAADKISAVSVALALSATMILTGILSGLACVFRDSNPKATHD